MNLLPPQNIDKELYQFLTRLSTQIKEIKTTSSNTVTNRNLQLTISNFIKGLSNVDNTNDKQKPISDKTQEALNNKVNVVDVVDNLTSSDIGKPLSANQGLQLKSLIGGLEQRIQDLESV
jgi:regulator of replication initiation timing